MITTPVPTVALLAAARAMTEPEPPADLGLERAVRESLFPSASSLPRAVAGNARSSEPPPSSERRAAHQRQREVEPGEAQLLPSEPFEFELTPRSIRRGPAATFHAPPLVEELGFDHLLAEIKPQRSAWQWLRAYGVWLLAALLVLWLITSFAASWLAG